MFSTRLLQLLIAICIASAILSGIVWISQGARTSATDIQQNGIQSSSQSEDSAIVAGSYQGTVVLQGVFNGVYSDTRAISTTIDLGYIDLALTLNQSNTDVKGFVDLDNTMVFTAVHTLSVPQPMPIGPRVEGVFDGSRLMLASEPFTMQMGPTRTVSFNGEQRIIPNITIVRQFQLITDLIQPDGKTLTGEYRETIWRYGPEPTTVIGRFSLANGAFSAEGIVPEPSKLYLPIISAAEPVTDTSSAIIGLDVLPLQADQPINTRLYFKQADNIVGFNLLVQLGSSLDLVTENAFTLNSVFLPAVFVGEHPLNSVKVVDATHLRLISLGLAITPGAIEIGHLHLMPKPGIPMESEHMVTVTGEINYADKGIVTIEPIVIRFQVNLSTQ